MKNTTGPHHDHGSTAVSDDTDARPTGGDSSPAPAVRDIHAAHARLAGAIGLTPCGESRALGAEAGVRLFLKHDHLQASGSFKERGAANALACLSAGERLRGVVAASAGNHALGLARHGARLGIPVTIVMPRGAARVKVERCRALGAIVRLEGGSFEAADVAARAIAVREQRRYVHPFDDVAVMAGQGTMGLEMLEQVPNLEAIVLPVGGGGLLGGVAVAVKAARPDVVLIAVEPAAAASYTAAWEANGPISVSVRPTLADGLSVARVGQLTFAASRGLVDAIVTVSEDEIAYAMLRLFEMERTAVEGAGAVALVALLAGKLPWLAGRRVVAPVCGANVDAGTFARALQMAGAALAS